MTNWDSAGNFESNRSVQPFSAGSSLKLEAIGLGCPGGGITSVVLHDVFGIFKCLRADVELCLGDQESDVLVAGVGCQ